MLTVSSIAFAVLIAVVMRGFQLGTYDNMIEGTLKATSGHVQLQHQAWWDDKTIDNIFNNSAELNQYIQSMPNVVDYYPRFQNFALVSNGPHTKGVPVFGIEPDKEKQATALNELLIKGQYLEAADQGVLISKELARYMKAQVNDSVVLFSQGYHGVTAVGKYPVRGIFDYSFSTLGNAVVYMTLPQAQELYGAYGKITTLSIALKDKDQSDQTIEQMEKDLGQFGTIRAMHWKSLNKALLDSIRMDSLSGQIMISVLYMVIGFGIFGTLLMMAAERRREFAIINSVGMKKNAIMKLVFLETLLLAAVAVVVGMIISIPVKIYFYFNPIYFSGEVAQMFAQYNIEPVVIMSGEMGYIYAQALIVFILSLISMSAPLNLIHKLNIVNSLRGR